MISRMAEGDDRGTLERFGFSCANVTGSTRNAASSDTDYASLKELATSLCDPAKGEGRESKALASK